MTSIAVEIDRLLTRYYSMSIKRRDGTAPDHYSAERCLADIRDIVERERIRELETEAAK